MNIYYLPVALNTSLQQSFQEPLREWITSSYQMRKLMLIWGDKITYFSKYDASENSDSDLFSSSLQPFL